MLLTTIDISWEPIINTVALLFGGAGGFIIKWQIEKSDKQREEKIKEVDNHLIATDQQVEQLKKYYSSLALDFQKQLAEMERRLQSSISQLINRN